MSIDIGFVTEAAGCNSAIELITGALKPTVHIYNPNRPVTISFTKKIGDDEEPTLTDTDWRATTQRNTSGSDKNFPCLDI
jgi:hypothetical protein